MSAEPIEIVDYDARWPALYDTAADELRHALNPWLVAIEHIGSTAIPGLPAKPVIDIQVGVTSLTHTGEIVPAVEALGYDHVPTTKPNYPTAGTSGDCHRRVDGRTKAISWSAPTRGGSPPSFS